MLAGHGQAGHGSMEPPGLATHDILAVDLQAASALDQDATMPAGVEMAATCFAVLAALLLLGAGARRAKVVRGWLGSTAGGRPTRRRAQPRARSPVELCVSRT